MPDSMPDKDLETPAYRFEKPLQEGMVLARPNRFIMDVELDGEEIRCHCPTVSRIGTLDTAGRPCLVSESANPKRKFSHTVEAVSLNQPEDESKHWIGINQTASNRYVEFFLKHDGFKRIFGPIHELRREVSVGHSRLDFAIDDRMYLEVKTPLVQLQLPFPDYVKTLSDPPFSSTQRALKHLCELASTLKDHQRAAVLYCFYYDNPGFRFYHGTTYDKVHRTVEQCRLEGVELWQANFAFTPDGVSLKKYWPLELHWDE